GVGAAAALLITFLGGDDETPVAEEEPSAPAEETATDEEAAEDEPTQDGAAEEEAEQSEDDSQNALEEARTAVASLPEDSACEADEDSEVVAAFISAGTETDDFPGDEADLLEDTFADLQSDCSTTHAAS